MNNDVKYQVCERCVMDTTDMDITFDENGYCNHCTNAIAVNEHNKKNNEKSQEKLDLVIGNIQAKGKNQKYDCIVGISGGVDSCYIAYLCKTHGLKPLLVHMDNGWDTEISVKNIKNIVRKLDLDYVSYVLDWQEFKEIQLGFLKSSIVDLEYPTDLAISAALNKMATKYNIHYIISGSNNSSEGILPLTWGYHVKRDMKIYRHIVKKFSKLPLKKVPVSGLINEFYVKFIKNVRTIYLLNYIDYDKDEAKKLLIDKFQWEEYGGKHHESKITAFWQSYVMPVKYNMDYRKATLSSQIVAGITTREVALEELKSLPYNPATVESDKEFVAKKYNISVNDLNTYLSLPPKTYKDFPNEKGLVDFVSRMYVKLFPNKRL